MQAFDTLTRSTAAERASLQSAPVIADALAGRIDRDRYLAFLGQAYHHVRNTVPLLMAVGARLEERQHWLQKEIVHYLHEEIGHEQWILADIEAAGGDAQATRCSSPCVATDAMIAYAWDTVTRRNPVAFFGMVHVLEGTSADLALAAAERIQATLHLPDRAFTYLRSHGKLDQEHVRHLAGIVERLDATRDLPAVIACARAMYWLYGSMFRSLDEGAVAGRRACG